MVHSSDTPPDGDFARYTEQVNARSAAVAWLGYRLNKAPRGVLLLQLRERIRQAAEKFEPRK